jgi:hypothetical protein
VELAESEKTGSSADNASELSTPIKCFIIKVLSFIFEKVTLT